MARPRLLTPELQKRLETWIRSGNSIVVACKACEIAQSTFHDWLKRGEAVELARDAGGDVDAGEVVFEEFRAAIRRAEDETEAALVAMITRSAQKGSWQAAAWVLERRNPERWGKPGERSNGPRAIDEAPVPERDPFDELAVVTDELAERRRAS